MNLLKIPADQRHRFTIPLGRLITGKRSETIKEVIKTVKKIQSQGFALAFYLVGDVVSEDFMESDFLRSFIKLCIVDEKTQRSEMKLQFESFFEETLSLINPQGCINMDSFTLLEKILQSNKPTLLKITEGEEDLLVLPLVKAIPLSSDIKHLVFYGQPPVTDAKNPIPQGIVLADIDEEKKKLIDNLIGLMEKI
ncbi:MAG: DUF359 domain-containing protein [Promethearchaeota archaeon]